MYVDRFRFAYNNILLRVCS